MEKLINIGPKLQTTLESVGINSFHDLKSIGTEAAFIRIISIDPTACINMLYAIEGAVQNIRWHSLDKQKKQELKYFFDKL